MPTLPSLSATLTNTWHTSDMALLSPHCRAPYMGRRNTVVSIRSTVVAGLMVEILDRFGWKGHRKVDDDVTWPFAVVWLSRPTRSLRASAASSGE